MKLSEIHIDRYGPLSRFTHTCTDNFEVIYGPNESGKTLLLEAILRVLSPDIDTAMPHVARVEETPSGYVVIERNGTEQKLDERSELADFIDLSPRHLRNIFVIRDSDLEMRDEHDFYDSITQQIGDLHTNEINAIQSRLVDRGRLTSIDGRGLSRARGNDNAEDVRDAAKDLAAEISEYITKAKANEIGAVEQEYISITTQLQQCEDDLADQQDAKTWDRHATLTQRLDTYRSAKRNLDDDISQSTLEQLEQLDREISAATDEIDELEQKRASLRDERDQLETKRESVNAELTSLQSRIENVDAVTAALESFRDTYDDSIGATRGMRVAKFITLTGLAFGGIAAIIGSPIPAVVLIALGSIAASWYGLQHRSVTTAERNRERVLQDARDAGLDVATVTDIAPAIRAFRDEVHRLETRRDELNRQLDVKNELLTDYTDDLETERQHRRSSQQSKQELLGNVDATNVAEYRNRVAAQESLKRERDEAAQSLSDALGTPPRTEKTTGAKQDYWDAELDALVEDIDEDVSAEDFDADQLAQLRENCKQLTQRQEALREQLDEHNRVVREFEDRIQAISAEPFISSSVSLQARSLDGLQATVDELTDLVDRIERDADIAREALDIFDKIQREEEQKITDLFGEGSRATEVFCKITNDRYTNVTYDPVAKELLVHRDGEDLSPSQLSHGTTEQLYLAARVGLAEQLLGSEPGFFLLDDAFLPADGERLRVGFEVLRDLAMEGWQILYFTAKDEIGRDLVSEHELRCRELDRLN